MTRGLSDRLRGIQLEVEGVFQPGVSIFYPLHGPGEIVREETIQRGDGSKNYFIVEFYMKDLQIMVPEDFEPERSRRLVPEEEFMDQLDAVREEILNQDYRDGKIQKVPRSRLEALEENIQLGDLGEMMEALHRLHARFLERNMNLGEKRVYDLAKEYCTGELIGVGGYERAEAEKLMYDYLPGVIPRLERQKRRGAAS